MNRKMIMLAVLVGGMMGKTLYGAAEAPYDSREVSKTWYDLSRAIEWGRIENVKVIVPALIARTQRRKELVKPGKGTIPSQGKTAYEIAQFHYRNAVQEDDPGKEAVTRRQKLFAIVEYLKPGELIAQEEQKMAGVAAPGGALVPADQDEAAQRNRINDLARDIGGLFQNDFYVALAVADSLNTLVKKSGYVAQPVQHKGGYVGMVIEPILEKAIRAVDAELVEAIMNGGYIGADRLSRFQDIFNENYREADDPHGPGYLNRDGKIIALRNGNSAQQKMFLKIRNIGTVLQIP